MAKEYKSIPAMENRELINKVQVSKAQFSVYSPIVSLYSCYVTDLQNWLKMIIIIFLLLSVCLQVVWEVAGQGSVCLGRAALGCNNWLALSLLQDHGSSPQVSHGSWTSRMGRVYFSYVRGRGAKEKVNACQFSSTPPGSDMVLLLPTYH